MRPCTPRSSNSLSIGFNVSNPSGVINATDIKTHHNYAKPSSIADSTLRPSPFAMSSEDVAKSSKRFDSDIKTPHIINTILAIIPAAAAESREIYFYAE